MKSDCMKFSNSFVENIVIFVQIKMIFIFWFIAFEELMKSRIIRVILQKIG